MIIIETIFQLISGIALTAFVLSVFLAYQQKDKVQKKPKTKTKQPRHKVTGRFIEKSFYSVSQMRRDHGLKA